MSNEAGNNPPGEAKLEIASVALKMMVAVRFQDVFGVVYAGWWSRD